MQFLKKNLQKLKAIWNIKVLWLYEPTRKKNPKKTWDHGFFFFFFHPILCAKWIDEYPQGDLTKFGQRSKKIVKMLSNLTSIIPF
jgi:hypothetical protein